MNDRAASGGTETNHLLRQTFGGMTMNRRTLTAALVGAFTAAVVGFGAVQADAQTKVGFVYVGPIGDHGWTYRHDQGRLAIEEAFGDQVETSFVESVKKARTPNASSVSWPVPVTT